MDHRGERSHSQPEGKEVCKKMSCETWTLRNGSDLDRQEECVADGIDVAAAESWEKQGVLLVVQRTARKLWGGVSGGWWGDSECWAV